MFRLAPRLACAALGVALTTGLVHATAATDPAHATETTDPATFSVDARLDGTTLMVTFDTAQPLGDGGRHPVLQLDLPDGVRLVERPIEDPQGRRATLDLYSGFPWGRFVFAPEVEIPLEIDADADGTIALNVTTYLDGERPEDAVFVRRRLELEASYGATARTVEPTTTAWGPGGLTHVGDRAPAFDLPAGVGDRLVLADELAHGQPLFLLTYRSDW